MNRKYIWLISCVSAILLSFLLPWIVLSIMEYSEKKEITRVDYSGQLQDYGSLSVAQKQAMLSSAELNISDDRSISRQDHENLVSAFRNEINKLFDCGAIPECMQQAFSQELHLQAKLALLAEDGRAFRYCEISNESETAVAIYDIDRNLVLELLLYGHTDQYHIDLGISEEGDFEKAVTEELRSWANYFGCSVQNISVNLNDEELFGQIDTVEAVFSDGIDQFYFGLIYDFNKEILCWGCSYLGTERITESEMY